ncbi:MAG: anhydro-N-acetylmuramic acid kinase [Anaerolineae bacterium]|nr:anhydro-N-acetylmuramic acid kinase [Anaerolineae bacterium]
MLVVGLMSGTSADGLDAALCEITGSPPSLSVRLVAGHSLDYPTELRAAILAACNPATSGIDALCRLNFDLAETFASAVSYVKQLTGLTPDLIASHGQTVWHDVAADGRVTSTLQIVEAAVIAERTGITTISNFRARDVSAGGQGAPLVAYVDALTLRPQTGWRAVQNLGGIGNVTFVGGETPHPLNPPLPQGARGTLLNAALTPSPSPSQAGRGGDTGAAREEGQLLGGHTTSSLITHHSSLLLPSSLSFDTGPANVLIDHAARVFTGQPYDVDGALAAAGRIDEGWLTDLLEHPYFDRQPPKTTGRELYTAAYADALLVEGARRGLSPADITATLTALTAASLADQYRRFGPKPLGEVVIRRGG